MTKKEKQKLARKCGYEYVYSGKTKSGYFKELNRVHNLDISPSNITELKKVIKQEK